MVEAVDMESASWNMQTVLAQHWWEGFLVERIFSNALFGSSVKDQATYLWIIVSEEQQQRLRSKGVRRKFNILNQELLEQSRIPLSELELKRPFISVVSEVKVPRLYAWANQKGIDIL